MRLATAVLIAVIALGGSAYSIRIFGWTGDALLGISAIFLITGIATALAGMVSGRAQLRASSEGGEDV